MPLQLSKFTDLSLLFIILEPYHYNFKTIQNMPLHTPSTCFSKFMDQNTPSLLLPLIPSLFPLSTLPDPPRATNTSVERRATWAHPPRAPPAASARSPAAWAWPPRARRLPSQQPTERERRGAGGGRSEEEEEGLLRRREARRLPGVDLAEPPWEAAWEERGGGDAGRRRCPGRREAHREARRHCWPATASRAAVAVPDHRPPPAKLELVPTRRRLPAATSPERRGGR